MATSTQRTLVKSSISGLGIDESIPDHRILKDKTKKPLVHIKKKKRRRNKKKKKRNRTEDDGKDASSSISQTSDTKKARSSTSIVANQTIEEEVAIDDEARAQAHLLREREGLVIAEKEASDIRAAYLEEELKKSQQKNADMRRQLIMLTAQAQQPAQQRANLILSSKDIQIDDLTNRVAELEDELEKQKAETDYTKELLEAWQLGAKQLEIDANEMVSGLEAQIEELQGRLTQENEAYDYQTQILEETEKKRLMVAVNRDQMAHKYFKTMDDTQAKLKAAHQAIKDERVRKEHAERRVEMLRSKVAELKKQLKNHKANSQKSIQDMELHCQTLEKKLKSLYSGGTGAQTVSYESGKISPTLANTIETEKDRTIKRLEISLEETTRMAEESMRRAVKLERSTEDIIKQRDKFRREKMEAVQDKDRAIASLKKAEAQVERAKENLEKLRDIYERKITNLERKIEDVKTEFKQKETAMSEQIVENMDAQMRLDDTYKKYDELKHIYNELKAAYDKLVECNKKYVEAEKKWISDIRQQKETNKKLVDFLQDKDKQIEELVSLSRSPSPTILSSSPSILPQQQIPDSPSATSIGSIPFPETQKSAIDPTYINLIECMAGAWVMTLAQILKDLTRLGFGTNPLLISLLKDYVSYKKAMQNLIIYRKDETKDHSKFPVDELNVVNNFHNKAIKESPEGHPHPVEGVQNVFEICSKAYEKIMDAFLSIRQQFLTAKNGFDAHTKNMMERFKEELLAIKFSIGGEKKEGKEKMAKDLETHEDYVNQSIAVLSSTQGQYQTLIAGLNHTRTFLQVLNSKLDIKKKDD